LRYFWENQRINTLFSNLKTQNLDQTMPKIWVFFENKL